MTFRCWKQPRRITGRTVAFRNTQVTDGDSILNLCTDELKSRHISPTRNDLGAQQNHERRYAESDDGIYFTVESLDGEPIGTVRMYDAQGDSFSWGSWIMKRGAPVAAAVESALIVYCFALDHLGFARAHCLVRRDNVRVWKPHE